MSRVLIAIGCNNYDSLKQLNGAEKDAQRIYDTLTKQHLGNFDPAKSLLLNSPTLTELREKFHELLFKDPIRIETLCIYFSGHGGVKTGSYYLCLKNSDTDALSYNALNVSELYGIINEVGPLQSNIIIDACNTGGVALDISNLLKTDLLGGSGTPGITIFGACASDQYAYEGSDGGYATNELLGLLDGKSIVQTTRPYLDLAEIGRIASQNVAKIKGAQTPAVWGLNLFGASNFSKNPHYNSTSPHQLFSSKSINVEPGTQDLISSNSSSLWQHYFQLPDKFRPRILVNDLKSFKKYFHSSENSYPLFIVGIASSLSTRAEESTDLFLEAELLATCIFPLLEKASEIDLYQGAILSLSDRTSERFIRKAHELLTLLDSNQYALLNTNGGFSDLYTLPIRISKIFGWLSACILTANWQGKDNYEFENNIKKIFSKIINIYGDSIVVVSDSQTPYLAAYFKCCRLMGWEEQAECVLGRYINSLIVEKGRIASPHIKHEQLLDFVLQRAANTDTPNYELLAAPDEFTSMLLYFSINYGIEELFDPYLRQLDHHNFNVFLPYNHQEFSEETIHAGRNLTFQIGHGVWKSSDFVDQLKPISNELLKQDASLNVVAVKIASLYASLIFPDRTPWFLILDN